MGYGRSRLSAITAIADTDRFITSTNMKVGDYGAPAVAGAMPAVGTARHVTITRTFNVAADTPGTILVTGTNLLGQVITETLTPSAVDATTVEGVKWFATVTAVEGIGWVIVAAANDTIVVGCAATAVVADGSGTLHGIQINTTAAGTITVADSGGTIAVLPVSVAVGTFYLWDVNFSGYLSLALAAASDITVLHSGSQPDYATA